MNTFTATSGQMREGIWHVFFKSQLKGLLVCFFLIWAILMMPQDVWAQQTYDFSTPASLSGATASWPWNTTATITIGGVNYTMTCGGNGSFTNVSSGGNGNSAALRKDGSGGDSFTLKRTDGKRFQFYGIWLKQSSMSGYLGTPPIYTVNMSDGGTTVKTYTENNASTTTAYAENIGVTSVSFNFNALNYYVIDDIMVGPAQISPPTVTTGTVSNAGGTLATVGGNITNDGGDVIQDRGIVWSTSQNPTTANSKASAGNGNGAFSAQLTGLSTTTTYYARSYAINSAGTAYGNQVTFMTTDGSGPVTLDPNMDTSFDDSGNYPTETDCYVGYNPAYGHQEAAIKFNLPVLSGTISSAKLRVKVNYIEGSGNLLKAWASTNESWVEFTATVPSKDQALSQVNVPGTGWVELDITDYVKTKYAGSGVVSLVLTGNTSTGSNSDVYFNSRENATDHPQLVISTTTALSSDANLTGLALSTGTLSPAFAAGAASYTAIVPNTTTSVTVIPTVADGTATVKVNGTSVASGTSSSPVGLNVGANTITSVVTAQDGTTTKSYTVTVTRAGSPNANLANLTLSAGTLSPAFSTGTLNYSASVANTVTSMDLTPTVADANATVTVNGVAAVSGNAVTVPLHVGSNTLATVVTAQDGVVTQTYTATVTRATSSNADLASLTLSAGTLTPAFAAATTSYTASVGYAVSALTLTPTLADNQATVKVNGAGVSSGSASAAIPLNEGVNTLTVAVTAQDGSPKTYTLIVTRDNAPLVLGASKTNPTCETAADGTATVQVAGGLAPYTYSWSPAGGSNATATGLAAGSFTVTVTDANNRTETATLQLNAEDTQKPTISAPAALTVSTDAGKNTASGVSLGSPVTADNCQVASVTNDAPASFALGQTTVTWTVTDGAGNTATATQLVTLQDTEAPVPVIAALPAVTGECAVTVTAPTATDNVAGTVTATTTDPLEYKEQGTYTVTWTYNDGNGNTSTQIQQVVVKDETAPVFAAVATITKTNDADKCGAVITYTMPTATDNCSALPDPNAVYTLNSGGQLYDFVNKQQEIQSSPGLPISFTPTDGNKMAVFLVNGSTTANISQNITLPSTGPVELTFDLQYKNHNGSFDSNNQFMAVEVRNPDTDALLRTVFKTEPGAALSIPMTSYRFDISEFAGQHVKLVLTNTNIQLFFFDILLDNIKVPGSTLVNGSFETGDYTGWTISESGAGAWGIGTGKITPVTITQTAGLSSGSLFPVGTTTNTFTATDAAGNTSTISFDVTVTDTQKPVVLTKNITVTLDATGVASITADQINNGSTDNCELPGNALSLDLTSFDCSKVGEQTVTLTVTDAAGNTNSRTAIVTVEDNTAPIAKAKAITVTLDAAGNASITPEMVNDGSSDVCGTVILALSQTTFDCFNLGENTVTLTVTDGSDNEATATAIVTVEDTTAPIAKAKNITVQLDAEGKATITAEDVNDNSTDNCGIETIALDITTFNCSNLGANSVTLTVADKSGNTHTATATVTVEDKVAPVARAKDITVQLDALGNAQITPADVDNGSTDNCGIASLALSEAVFDCAHVGVNTVTLTVTDNSGNVSTTTATVTVEDKIAPTAVTQNFTVQLDAAGKAILAAAAVDNGSSDVCGTVILSLDKTAFDCSNIGANTVTLTVTDKSGNVATETAIVTIVDASAPLVLTQNITVSLDATGQATITTAQINNGSSDNCGVASMTLDVTEFSCEDTGVNNVTLTVTDVNGNVATGTATVTIIDQIPPAAFAKNITAELDVNGIVSITAEQVNDNSSDNCGIATLTLSKYSFDCSNLGANEVNLLVTDKAGNITIAAATVTIEDNSNPTITAPAAVVVNVDAGKNSASGVALGTPVTADNCSVTAISNDAPAVYPTGTTTITWTVTDASGNTATATQTVTVRPNVVAVAPLATIKVPIRTAYANVPLPATATVTYTNGGTATIGVNWSQGSYNGLVAGPYVLTGQLILAENTTNLSNKLATVTVEVQPNKVPTALAFSATTFKPEAAAADVIGTLTTTDEDDNAFVYELASGQGDTDNDLFEVRGDKVYLKSNRGLSGMTSFSIRVRSTDPYLNTIEKSFTLTKEQYAKAEAQLKIVNAFSPDGDGINDTWTIPELRFYNQVEIEVYDRSGVRLFHTTNPEEGWNGQDTNGLVRQGAFLYIVQVKDINMVKKGVVTVLKK